MCDGLTNLKLFPFTPFHITAIIDFLIGTIIIIIFDEKYFPVSILICLVKIYERLNCHMLFFIIIVSLPCIKTVAVTFSVLDIILLVLDCIRVSSEDDT